MLLKYSPNDDLLTLATATSDIASKIPEHNPLKTFYRLLSQQLHPEEETVSINRDYIKYHDDFKIILDCLHAISKDKKLPVSINSLKNHLLNVLISPYIKNCYLKYWQEIFTLIIKRPRMLHFKELVCKVANKCQRDEFRKIKPYRLEEKFYADYGVQPGHEFDNKYQLLLDKSKQITQAQNAITKEKNKITN